MISIIVPLHNEAAAISANFPKIKKTADRLGPDYEIILAEDGSTDNTRQIAGNLASGKIRLLTSEKKLGRGLALSRAMVSAKGDIIVYMDADLAADLRHLKALVSEIENGADISTGSRLVPGSKVHSRSFLREFFSRGYNLLLRLLFRTSIHDHQCGFKAFRRSRIVPLLKEVEDKHWFWDSELLIRAQKKGLKVAEIPVEWTDSKGSSVKLPSDIPSMGLSALLLRLRL
ncbi:glycosyltransferase family 2 protein [Candidatus Micrarchaeota archaeon]|nr:glycosyltransferase family 2 protein [Candidatus Micrarchaeota archaeon]